MPRRATEIATLPLLPGTDLTTGEADKTWQAAVSTIASQPGNISVHWGLQVEHPDVVQFVIGESPLSFPSLKHNSLTIHSRF